VPTRRKHSKPGSASPARLSPRGERSTPLGDSTLIGVARQVRSWTDSVLGIAGAAADLSMSAAKAVLVKPEQRAVVERAGSALRTTREAAGLSIKELGDAINLKDPALLDLVENGKAALPFEIVLRLASVLGRNDPISFIMRFTRSFNPDVWKTLESLGIGRLAVQAGREREFANIYRGCDAARTLSDEEFAAMLEFMKRTFDLALAFRSESAAQRRRTSRSVPTAR
jgi:transcriptional regulator with XRE-family HTH domain